jgi:hypothetical protein
MMERTFAVLDRLDAPDIRRSIDQRRAGDEDLRPIPKPPGGRRRATAALLALAVFAAAAAFGLRTWTRDQHPQPVSDPWSWAGEGWTRITDPPQRHAGATWVWAGDHLLVWGGCTGDTECAPTDQGFVYDPRGRTWSPIPAAPRPGHDEQAVAIGDRIYLFGRDGSGSVFDGARNAWSELPRAPIQTGQAVWTGSRIIVLQNADPSGDGSAAASFDPATSEWRTLARPPIDFNVASVTWTGREVLVLSGLLNGRNVPASPTVDAMSLDPESGTWRVLPDTALDPGSFASAYMDGRLFAWDYGTTWQTFDPNTETWSRASKLPLQESECYVSGATVSSVVFDWNCGTPAIFDDGAWQTLRGGPVEETIYSKAYKREIGVWRFADLVPAGDVLVLPLTGITLAESGEACYGCPGSPESLWVYRPPSDVVSSKESPPGPLWPGIGEGLTALPAPPRLLVSAVEVWTDRGLVLWGGNERFGDPPHYNEGYLFDARNLTWHKIAPSPLAGRSWAAGVWTGSEVVIWGGADGQAVNEEVLNDGAAYDPTTDTWRSIAPAPISTSILDSVWTGTEMLVFGDGASAAYDPVNDAWRTIPDPPVDLSQADAVWTGREAVLLGAYLASSDNASRTQTAVGAAFDPSSMSWRSLPASDLDPQATTAVWDGAHVVALDYLLGGSLFDPYGVQTWSRMPRMPFNACEGYPQAAASHGVVLAQFCGDTGTLSSGDELWHVTGQGELPYGFDLSPIAAGDAFVLLGPGRKSGSSRMYVYVPTSRVTDEGRAWDVAASVAALRSNYPFEPQSVPAEIEDEIRTLLSPDAYATWQEPSTGLGPLWTYYTGFQVRSVVPGAAASTFEAHVRFSTYSGSDRWYDEILIVGPGVDLDGSRHDFLVVDAKPG